MRDTAEEGDASNLETFSRCDISLVGRHARQAFESRFCLMQDSSVTCVITQQSVIITRAYKLSQSAYFSSMWLEERGGKSRLKKRSRSRELAWWIFLLLYVVGGLVSGNNWWGRAEEGKGRIFK